MKKIKLLSCPNLLKVAHGEQMHVTRVRIYISGLVAKTISSQIIHDGELRDRKDDAGVAIVTVSGIDANSLSLTRT